jgi:hypothetical protein
MKFKNIEEIPSRFVPTDSVFREFIGKESWFQGLFAGQTSLNIREGFENENFV